MQVRVARPAADLGATAFFYRDLVGLPVLASFDDHDGFSGVVFGLPDASAQLELVEHAEVGPSPTSEDQLVLYLGSETAVDELGRRLADGGARRVAPRNPYWEKTGGRCFVDPDGYLLVLSPLAW